MHDLTEDMETLEAEWVISDLKEAFLWVVGVWLYIEWFIMKILIYHIVLTVYTIKYFYCDLVNLLHPYLIYYSTSTARLSRILNLNKVILSITIATFSNDIFVKNCPQHNFTTMHLIYT